MVNLVKKITQTLPTIFTGFDILDGILLAVFFIFFMFIFSLLNKNNANKISLLFMVYLIAVSAICIEAGSSRIEYTLLIVAFVICIVLLFATEIKRSVWNVKINKGQTRDVANAVRSSAKTVTHNINEIIKALQAMSKNDIGAIIVLSNTKIPDNVLSSGVKIDADISSALIESVFFPKTPLHDGAMIIQNDKILAAGCFLPLSQETDLPKELGTRHRAGLGITEVLNVTAIIVSEETGIISIAQGGKINRYADSEALRKTLKEFYWQDLIGQK
ncbi:MAG: diadenylate cyclase [Clostridia bacterium]|nr:diadenylate cyclase [Clostridia bacterium]